MELNLLKLGFALKTLFMIIFGGLINNYEKHLPSFIIGSFQYGKLSYYGKSPSIKVLEVPKRWFQHFYLYSSLLSVVILFLMIKLLLTAEVPVSVVKVLDLIGTSNRKAGVSGTAAFVGLLLLSLQSWRRLYETTVVSVFSDSKMNIMHYIVGFTHYTGSFFAILVEAPGFTALSFEYRVGLSLWDINWRMAMGVIIFSLGWYNQFASCKILGNLRKNKNGRVVSMKHGLPQGGLFELVSSPLQLCEILIYIGLAIILWGNTVFPYVLFWVLSNQMETALLNHWWYLAEFKEYPKERKAVIPYVL